MGRVYACDIACVMEDKPNQVGNIPKGGKVYGRIGERGEMFVKFNVADLISKDGNLTSLAGVFYTAPVPYFVQYGGNSAYVKLGLADNNWTGATVTWNTKPTYGNLSSYTGDISAPYVCQYPNYYNFMSNYDRSADISLVISYYDNMYGTSLSMNPHDWYIDFVFDDLPRTSPVDPGGTLDNPRILGNYTDNAKLSFYYNTRDNTNADKIEVELYDEKLNLLESHGDINNMLTAPFSSKSCYSSGYIDVLPYLSGVSKTPPQGALVYGKNGYYHDYYGRYSYYLRANLATHGLSVGDTVVGAAYIRVPYGTNIYCAIVPNSTDNINSVANAKVFTYLGNTMLTGVAPLYNNSFMWVYTNPYLITSGYDIYFEVGNNNTNYQVLMVDTPMISKGSKASPIRFSGQYDYTPKEGMLQNNKVYCYRYRVKNGFGYSNWSDYDFFMPKLTKPSGMSLIASSDTPMITLNLPTILGDNIKEVRIYRSCDGGDMILRDTISPNQTEYIDTLLKPDIFYSYSYQTVGTNYDLSPISDEVMGKVSYRGSYLSGVYVKVKNIPQFNYERIMSKRYRMDGTMVTYDKGYGAKLMSLNILFVNELEKDDIIGILSKKKEVNYVDSRGYIFSGVPYKTEVLFFPVTGYQIGIVSIVLEG